MDYYDLGSYSCKITTTSSDAQTWFDRGLNWVYAYNHEAAIVCFEKALQADADCAMAHWGIAYAIGPNYNNPWEAFEPDEKIDALALALGSVAKAEALAGTVKDIEQALIGAIRHRYPEDAGIDDFAPWNDAYVDSDQGQAYNMTEFLSHPPSWIRMSRPRAEIRRAPSPKRFRTTRTVLIRPDT